MISLEYNHTEKLPQRDDAISTEGFNRRNITTLTAFTFGSWL